MSIILFPIVVNGQTADQLDNLMARGESAQARSKSWSNGRKYFVYQR